MSSYSGKTAIVTGASSGIGRASAEALARAGFSVFGTSRRPGGNTPDGVTMLTCDVTDDASVNILISTCSREPAGSTSWSTMRVSASLGARKSPLSLRFKLCSMLISSAFCASPMLRCLRCGFRAPAYRQYQLGFGAYARPILGLLFGDQARA